MSKILLSQNLQCLFLNIFQVELLLHLVRCSRPCPSTPFFPDFTAMPGCDLPCRTGSCSQESRGHKSWPWFSDGCMRKEKMIKKINHEYIFSIFLLSIAKMGFMYFMLRRCNQNHKAFLQLFFSKKIAWSVGTLHNWHWLFHCHL